MHDLGCISYGPVGRRYNNFFRKGPINIYEAGVQNEWWVGATVGGAYEIYGSLSMIYNLSIISEYEINLP
jgi:hypothetical protein